MYNSWKITCKEFDSMGKSLSEALIFVSINPQYDMFCQCSALVVLMVIPWTIFCHIVG